jgi:concanavalin A-like lectin/glucanase superfamily protein
MRMVGGRSPESRCRIDLLPFVSTSCRPRRFIMRAVPRRSPRIPLLVLALLGAFAGAAQAQPFGAWLTLSGPTHGYVQVPSSGALNPAGAITVEAWVDITDADGCSSIVGKNWQQSWWLGVCGTTFRTYLKGGLPSQYNAGIIPAGQWTHVAMVYDGTQRLHYINGELVGTHVETGPLPASADPLRIGSDVSWQHTPAGAIDEVRVWNVARTQDQIRSAINVTLGATPGLVARWGLDGNTLDPIGGHNGAVGGSGAFFFTFPVTLAPCSQTATALCLFNRYTVTARFRVGAPGTAEGTAQTVGCANPGSGLFWFFSADNWEVMVKAINGCGLNNRYWVFSAATTNVFYRLEIFDRHSGVNKVYFNYPGPPAPAVTDVNALATCP